MSERKWRVPVPAEAGPVVTVTHPGEEPLVLEVQDGMVSTDDERTARTVAGVFDAMYYPPDAEDLPEAPSTVDEEPEGPHPPAAVLGEIEDTEEPEPDVPADQSRTARKAR